jgi:hypothetical protein
VFSRAAKILWGRRSFFVVCPLAGRIITNACPGLSARRE